MSRRGPAQKRKINPDPRFKDKVIGKFINKMMQDGNKSVSERIFYGCLDIIKEKTKVEDPLTIFRQALENAKPLLEVRSRRVGGANYQVPVEVKADRRQALAMKWILGYATDRGERTMEERLAGELIDANESRGGSIKKREDVHKMAEANRAFAHYRW